MSVPSPPCHPYPRSGRSGRPHALELWDAVVAINLISLWPSARLSLSPYGYTPPAFVATLSSTITSSATRLTTVCAHSDFLIYFENEKKKGDKSSSSQRARCVYCLVAAAHSV